MYTPANSITMLSSFMQMFGKHLEGFEESVVDKLVSQRQEGLLCDNCCKAL